MDSGEYQTDPTCQPTVNSIYDALLFIRRNYGAVDARLRTGRKEFLAFIETASFQDHLSSSGSDQARAIREYLQCYIAIQGFTPREARILRSEFNLNLSESQLQDRRKQLGKESDESPGSNLQDCRQFDECHG